MLTCNTHDNAIRWKEGERLDHLFECRVDELEAEFGADHPAVDAEDGVTTFRELDNRANQVARYLRDRGLGSGDRIGLLFDKTVESYIAMLAVLKINAAYVPFDCSFPNDRIDFILEDAGVKAMLSLSAFEEKVEELSTVRIYLDAVATDIDRQDTARLSADEKGAASDELSYIIYTSGTTGKPKGVAIDHASICNFVRVAVEVYGYNALDRVYQGLTIAFDFSVEEIWVPLIAGATLVPAKPGYKMVGNELADFLLEKRVSAMCCVPTLLGTIDRDLPEMRLLIVSGEACPQDIVTRWHRPGRTILNAYGPTEATVTATLTELIPNKAVTIGAPLPTYTILVLAEDEARLVEPGGMGEICIAGIGLARGYLNREELTDEKFIPDFVGVENNPSERIYRTGDLGRINEDGEVEFHGRIDTQVKIRGYRIELGEIEAVLLDVPAIGQAVVDIYEPEPGAVELVGYYSLVDGAERPSQEELLEPLKQNLPSYMVPAFLEELDMIPMTVSDKADRKNLPAPSGPRVSLQSADHVAPTTDMERTVADVLASVLQVERVSITDDFFLDLGAHSLLMARFGSKLRQSAGLPDISMRDVYQNPTVEKLARLLETRDFASSPDVEIKTDPPHVASDLSYYVCGAMQLAFGLAYGLLGVWALVIGFEWTYPKIEDLPALYLRIVTFAAASFVGFSSLSIVAKWILIGRWKEEAIPIWSSKYFRFWAVKFLMRTSPMAAFVGTPVYNAYLRMLGAKIGRNVVIRAKLLPVCADLLTIGDDVIIRNDAIVQGYKAQNNYIYTGTIAIGDRAFVGQGSVIDIDTEIGREGQLGHASSLMAGQSIADGKRYHGCPAEETETNYCGLDPMPCSALRRWLYTLAPTVFGLAVLAPLAVIISYYLFPVTYQWTNGSGLDYAAPLSVLLSLAGEMALLSFGFVIATILLGLLAIFAIPRLANRFLRPDRVYALYGWHYFVQSIVSRATNSRFFNILFGDSSAVVHYLRLVGWNLNTIEQTGSNFGTTQKHDNPLLCEIGSGTMVSDGLAMMNAEMSSSSFRLSKVAIGDKNYLGNNIHFPAGAKTGSNCLFGTKTMIPIDGPVRENVGLLGAPAFEIPRANERDRTFDDDLDEASRLQQLAAKNRHNLVTVLLFLASNWMVSFVSLLLTYAGLLYYPLYGVLPIFAAGVGALAFAFLFYPLIERASLLFGRLTPRVVSIYDGYFWFHERHWKLSENPLAGLFNGTPLKNLFSRLQGVKIGKRVFDDGCGFLEKTLITVGDDTNLNAATTIQGHSLEEGVFKSDTVTIAQGCTIGTGAFVHYGVTMGENVLIGLDSFVMKGEILDANTVWLGNPAKPARVPAQPQTSREIRCASPERIDTVRPRVDTIDVLNLTDCPAPLATDETRETSSAGRQL